MEEEEEEEEEVVEQEEEREEEDGAGAVFRFLLAAGAGRASGWMGVCDARGRGRRSEGTEAEAKALAPVVAAPVAVAVVDARMTTLGVWGLARRFRSMYSQGTPWVVQRAQGKPPLQATFLLVQ